MKVLAALLLLLSVFSAFLLMCAGAYFEELSQQAKMAEYDADLLMRRKGVASIFILVSIISTVSLGFLSGYILG